MPIDVEADAQAAFEVLSAGGIAILPMSVGYSVIGGSAAALATIFETKRRAPTKLNAMLGDSTMHREIHLVDDETRAAVDVLTNQLDLPLGAIAPADMDHPLLAALEREAVAGSSKGGTVCMLLNAGPLHAEICRLSRENGHPLFGSSANLTMTGTKFRVEDIDPAIVGIADIVVDHGLRTFHPYQASSTLLDLTNWQVVRFGACYELIADALLRHVGIELPAPPEPGAVRDHWDRFHP